MFFSLLDCLDALMYRCGRPYVPKHVPDTPYVLSTTGINVRVVSPKRDVPEMARATGMVLIGVGPCAPYRLFVPLRIGSYCFLTECHAMTAPIVLIGYL